MKTKGAVGASICIRMEIAIKVNTVKIRWKVGVSTGLIA
jgi:hypothetical protein